jgi:CelD/BcsL family acetyltransferase involved in cellulose biosynthesis
MSIAEITSETSAGTAGITAFSMSQKACGQKPSGDRAPRANEPDLPSTGLTVELVRDPGQLRRWLPQWQRLVALAADANVFYEPAFLLPALDHLRGGDDVGVVLVHAPPRVNPEASPVLCGLFPVRLLRRFSGLPVRVAEVWRHDQCFLTTPLIRRDSLETVWTALQTWLRETPLFGRRRCDWLHLPMTAGSGPVHEMVVDWTERHGAKTLLRRRYRRAVLSRPESLEQFLSVHVPRKLRQESGRLRRKLEQSGPVTVRVTGSADGIDNLLRLEQAGWKGKAGTALASRPSTAGFARAAAEALSAAGQLEVLEFSVGARVVAAKLNLLSGRNAFGFKIAYDEEFAALSPGLLLEIENIGNMVRNAHIDWMDSCADPDHPMIDHLWPERRPVESLLLSCGTWRGDWLLAARPLMQQLLARRSRQRS